MNTELQMIEVERLIPTPDNPRVLREDKSFAELVESIRSVGILQPLIARPMSVEMELASMNLPSGTRPKTVGTGTLYDLRAGHRRLAAAKKAGLKTVPVVVREMDDKTAMEVTIAENLQRENLHPLEESRGIQRLLDVGWEIESIADRLGKSACWVARRAKLCELSPAWQKAIGDPARTVSTWPASLLELIARLPAATQDDVLENMQSSHWRQRKPSGSLESVIPTVQELNRYLQAEILHTLGGAPFKLDDETLLPKAGACSVCVKRASCQPMLFEDLDPVKKKGRKGGGDRCLDLACYSAKVEAFSKRKLDELKAQHGRADVVAEQYLSGRERQQYAKRYGLTPLDSWSFQKAKPNEKNARPAVVVQSDRPSKLGQVVWIKPNGSGTGAGSGRAKKTEGPRTLRERREALAKRRKTHVIEAVRARLTELADGAAELPTPLEDGAQAIALAVSFGTSHRFDSIHNTYDCRSGAAHDPWRALKSMPLVRKDALAAAQLTRAVLPVLHDRLHIFNGEQAVTAYPECKRVAELIGADLAELERAAAEAIPEPKSWAHLNADGTPKKPAAKKKATKKRTGATEAA